MSLIMYMFGDKYNEKFFFPERKNDKYKGPKDTLLAKTWTTIISSFVLLFIAYIVSLYYLSNYDNVFSYMLHTANIKLNCFKGNSSSQPSWLLMTHMFICGASFSAVSCNIIRTLLAATKSGYNKNILSAYVSGTLVMSMSFSGEAIHLSGLFNNVCIDAFGVKSPLIEISEWLITVPMMIYLNLTIDFKKQKLDSKDLSVLAAAYLTILFGFLPIVLNRTISYVSISLSGISCFYFLYTVLTDSIKSVAEYYKDDVKSLDLQNYIEFTFAKKKMYTAVMMALIFPAFPFTYITRASGLISEDVTEALFALFNFVSKCLYVIALMEDQLDVLDPKMMKLLFERKDGFDAAKTLQKEIELNRSLLNNAYPPRVVEDLRSKRSTKNMTHLATIFYSEVEGFAEIEAKLGSADCLCFLNELFSVMDHVASLFPSYKIETEKDSFMLVSGVFDDVAKDRDHAIHIANFAALVQSTVTIIKNPVTMKPLKLKIGINTGRVESGICGSKMARFNVYGITLDQTKIVAKFGEFNKIHCTETTAMLLPSTLFEMSKITLVKMKTESVKLKWNTCFILGSSETNEVSNVDASSSVRTIARQILANVDHSVHQSILREKYLISSSVSDVEMEKIKDKIKIDYRKFKILLVDSDSSVASHKKFLSNKVSTFQISTATNAEDALEIVRCDNNYDVIFVNDSLSLDGYKGHEFVEYVRKNLSMGQCVIAGIASIDEETHVQAVNFIKAGADIFYKEFTLNVEEIFILWLQRNLEINKQLETSSKHISRTAIVKEICDYVL